jgi:hypothetical protein
MIRAEPSRTPIGIAVAGDLGQGLQKGLQIWGPGQFRARLAEATAKARASGTRLGSERAAEDPLGARE